MKRREFIALFSAAIAMGSLAGASVAAAQSASRVWRVGYLSSRNGPSDLSQSVVRGLSEHGYVEGRNSSWSTGSPWEKTSG